MELISLNCHSDGRPLPLSPDTKELSLKAQARAVDVSHDGSLCAVGFRSGQVRVFKTVNWELARKVDEHQEWIEDLKFSPDGKFLAVSCHDNSVYVYGTTKFDLQCTLGGSTSFISHIDWSVDSGFLRTNDGSYELLHYTIAAGKLSPTPSI